MKTLAIAAATALGLAVGAPLQAQMGDAPKGTVQTVSGTVIDVSCKFGFGLSGADHRMCSQVCADKGIPLAILGSDGKLYIATGSGMPGEGQNARLKEFAEQQVRVTGKVFAAGGAHAIQIEKIERAS